MRRGVEKAYAEAGRTAAELFSAMGWTWHHLYDEDGGGSGIPSEADLALAFVSLVQSVDIQDEVSIAGSGRLVVVDDGEGDWSLCVEVGHIYYEEE